jgi:hypothetical protein
MVYCRCTKTTGCHLPCELSCACRLPTHLQESVALFPFGPPQRLWRRGGLPHPLQGPPAAEQQSMRLKQQQQQNQEGEEEGVVATTTHLAFSFPASGATEVRFRVVAG